MDEEKDPLYDDNIKPVSEKFIKYIEIIVMVALIGIFAYFMIYAWPELNDYKNCANLCNEWYSEFIAGDFKGNFSLWQNSTQ